VSFVVIIVIACYLLFFSMIFFNKKIKPSWIFPPKTSNGEKIWRLSVGNQILVAELRDVDRKTTEFAGIDLSSGAVLWRNDCLDERWWITLNLIYNGVILLQQFSRPDMPTSDRIYALDLRTGKLLWQNTEVSFLNVKDETIFCVKKSFSLEKIIGLNFRTGAERAISSSELPDENYSPALELLLPEPVEGHSENSQVEKIQMKIPADAKQPTTMKLEGKNIFGFHVPAGTDSHGVPLYDAHLIITGPAGKIIFEDIADTKVYVPLTDFYFMIGEKLIYVRNSNEIVAISVK